MSYFLFSDSTVLAYVLKKLNEEHNYGLELILLSVDEGITGYRDDSLEVQEISVLILRTCKGVMYIGYVKVKVKASLLYSCK